MSDPGEHCCCGNRLGDCSVRMISSPCRCDLPGPGKRTKEHRWLPGVFSKKQYEQRVALGLPPSTDIERGVERRWR